MKQPLPQLIDSGSVAAMENELTHREIRVSPSFPRSVNFMALTGGGSLPPCIKDKLPASEGITSEHGSQPMGEFGTRAQGQWSQTPKMETGPGHGSETVPNFFQNPRINREQSHYFGYGGGIQKDEGCLAYWSMCLVGAHAWVIG